LLRGSLEGLLSAFNTLTKKERKEYRTQTMSAIHGALKKIDLKKRTKKGSSRFVVGEGLKG
jgi:hypothetical protein